MSYSASPMSDTRPDSGFELVATMTREPRTVHSLYLLASGTLDIPKYVNFRKSYITETFERFQKREPYEYYWLVRHHKHGNIWKQFRTFSDYESALLWGRVEANSYKRHGYEVKFAIENVDFQAGMTVSINAPETVLAKEIVAADSALSSGKPHRIMDAITSIKGLEDEMVATLEIVTIKRKQLEKRFEGWFE